MNSSWTADVIDRASSAPMTSADPWMIRNSTPSSASNGSRMAQLPPRLFRRRVELTDASRA